MACRDSLEQTREAISFCLLVRQDGHRSRARCTCADPHRYLNHGSANRKGGACGGSRAASDLVVHFNKMQTFHDAVIVGLEPNFDINCNARGETPGLAHRLRKHVVALLPCSGRASSRRTRQQPAPKGRQEYAEPKNRKTQTFPRWDESGRSRFGLGVMQEPIRETWQRHDSRPPQRSSRGMQTHPPASRADSNTKVCSPPRRSNACDVSLNKARAPCA